MYIESRIRVTERITWGSFLFSVITWGLVWQAGAHLLIHLKHLPFRKRGRMRRQTLSKPALCSTQRTLPEPRWDSVFKWHGNCCYGNCFHHDRCPNSPILSASYCTFRISNHTFALTSRMTQESHQFNFS